MVAVVAFSEVNKDDAALRKVPAIEVAVVAVVVFPEANNDDAKVPYDVADVTRSPKVDATSSYKSIDYFYEELASIFRWSS